MKKFFLISFLLLLCLACNSKETKVYTFGELKDEFKDFFNNELTPKCTYFWDEFSGIEAQYGLTEDESKLLGAWENITFTTDTYNYYTFFPNKLFLFKFKFHNYRVINAEEIYFNKALGIWEIVDGIVRITIYAIMTENRTLDYPYNKDVFYIEQPYTVDFVNIDNIGEEGFTKRPIPNDAILSEELLKRVTIKEPNRTNNLYVRNVYTMDVIPELRKNYSYFQYFPEMAQEDHSGLDIVMDPELIKRYIPDWMD